KVSTGRLVQNSDVGFIGVEEDLPFPGGRDLVNPPLRPGAGNQVAFAVEKHRPDIGLLGIEELFGLPGRSNAVNLPVRRGADVEIVSGVDRKSVHLELLRVEEILEPAAL